MSRCPCSVIGTLRHPRTPFMSRRPCKERPMHPNEELVRREADAWDAGDPEAVVALYTPQAV